LIDRLITSGTLEEKIMGLQKFKLTIANTVISQENSSLQTMATDQLLDLFSLDNKESKSSEQHNNKNEKGMKGILSSLPDLWNTDAYESEYDLNSFVQTLKPL
jgi:TATA-binding protein-associated factor